MEITPIIDLWHTYYEQESNPGFPSWEYWIEVITEMDPVLRAGDDGILYLLD